MESFKAKTGRSKINHNASFKAKFCLCFKPVSSVDDAFEPPMLSTIFSSALMADGTDGWRHSSKKKGDDNGTCFWQILKKAFNHTTLVKKIKTRKAANKSRISRSSSDMKLEQKFEKNSKQECKSNRSPLESSNSSSLFTRSSLSSSTNPTSLSQNLGSSSSPSSSTTTTLSYTTVKRREDPKLRDKKKRTNPDDDKRTKALCYILVTSLLILILWGKVFAIICMSFWLYLLPRRSKLSEPPGPSYREEEEFDTAEYKKKVIMEGFLERNRSRLVSRDSIARPCS